MKKQKIQEESDNKEDNKEKSQKDFGDNLKQVWYEKSVKFLRINMLFLTNRVILRRN